MGRLVKARFAQDNLSILNKTSKSHPGQPRLDKIAPPPWTYPVGFGRECSFLSQLSERCFDFPYLGVEPYTARCDQEAINKRLCDSVNSPLSSISLPPLATVTMRLKALEAGLSCVPIPGLSMIVYTLEEIFNLIDEVHVRKRECKELAEFATAVFQAIANNAQDHGRRSPQFVSSVEQTRKSVMTIYEDMAKWKGYNRARAVLCSGDTLEEIRDHRTGLESCLKLLGLIHTFDHRAWQERFLKAQQEDSEVLNEISHKQDALLATMVEMQKVVTDLAARVQSDLVIPAREDPPQVKNAKENLFKMRVQPRLEGDVMPLRDLTGECRKIGTRPIHSGTAFDIWQGLWLDEHIVGMKVYRGTNELSKNRRFERQVDLWRTLDHPGVLKLYGHCSFADENVNSRVYLVTPWMKNRDAVTYISRFPSVDRLKLIVEVAVGLQYLHSVGIIHGGLQGSNILISDSESAVLSDFSLSKPVNPDTQFTQSNGPTASLRWLSPEAHNHAPMSYQSDVYSWAMTALQILSGRIPFYQIKPVGPLVIAIAVKGDKPRRQDYPCIDIDDDMWKLFLDCWATDPKKRPSIDSLLGSLRQICRARGKTYL